MIDKYAKIVYESEPIGKENIILYLTTYDLETFKNNENLEKIPTKTTAMAINIPEYIKSENSSFSVNYNAYQTKMFETMIEKFVRDTYEEQLEQMANTIEILRKTKIVPIEYDKNVKNISNSDDVHCNIVYGNISNCDNIYCNEIKGNVSNCNKIVYKKEIK